MLSACSKSKPDAPAVPASVSEIKPLLLSPQDLFDVRPLPFSPQIEVTGALEAGQRATLRSKVSGQVVAMLKREGDSLKAGEIVLRIDPTEARLRVTEREALWAAQKAQLAQADKNLSQQEQLFGRQFISESAVINARAARDAAASQLRAAQAQWDLAKQQLQDTEVKAPFSGVMGPIQVQLGSKVSSDTPLFELLDIQSLEFKALVTASQQSLIRTGQTAQLFLEGETLAVPAQVLRISPSTNGSTRSIPVYMGLKNPQLRLKAGQFGKAILQTSALREALMVPLTAVREVQGQTVVYRIDEQLVLRQQSVELGSELRQADQAPLVEVRAGLQAGQRIVGANLGPLKADSPVVLQTPSQSQP